MRKVEQNPLSTKSGDVFQTPLEKLLEKEKYRADLQAGITQELLGKLEKLERSSKEVVHFLRMILDEFRVHTKVVEGTFIADESFNVVVVELLRRSLKELENK